jgi:hypothetical protein
VSNTHAPLTMTSRVSHGSRRRGMGQAVESGWSSRPVFRVSSGRRRAKTPQDPGPLIARCSLRGTRVRSPSCHSPQPQHETLGGTLSQLACTHLKAVESRRFARSPTVGDLEHLVAGLQKGNRRSKRYPQIQLTKSTYQRVRERIGCVGRASSSLSA